MCIRDRHISDTISYVKNTCDDILVECLVGDFQGDVGGISTILDAKPDVYAHNVETVSRLTPTVRDQKAGYVQSLFVLEKAKKIAQQKKLKTYTKTSIMLGLGETRDELKQTFLDLKNAGVDFLTLGQYLQPSKKHLAVDRFVHPTEFDELKDLSMEYGFKYVASGPLVRSSYKAAEFFIESFIKKENTKTLEEQSLPVFFDADINLEKHIK